MSSGHVNWTPFEFSFTFTNIEHEIRSMFEGFPSYKLQSEIGNVLKFFTHIAITHIGVIKLSIKFTVYLRPTN